jgi:hypothetical protein
MDFVSTELELLELSEKQIELAEEYRKARRAFGKAKHNLQIYLVPRQTISKYQRSSLDRQIMMLLSDMAEEDDEEGLTKVNEAHRIFVRAQQEYKGLEKLIDAYTSRITVFQSLMRWQREND